MRSLYGGRVYMSILFGDRIMDASD